MTTDSRTKWCAKCQDALRVAHNAYCRECLNAYQRAYKKRRYATEPDYRRRAKAHVRMSLYGITEERYTELWAQQGGVCAICLCDPEETRGGVLHVDHDHSTGAVRSLLCGHCNQALGLLKERPYLMRRAARYVAKETCA